VTDKLRSYGVAHRELAPEVIHETSPYANNRAELSHPPTRVREGGRRRLKSAGQAQRFLGSMLLYATCLILVVTWCQPTTIGT
jgi:putative transposase